MNSSNLVPLAQVQPQADSAFGSLGFTLQKEEHADEIKIKAAEYRGGVAFLEDSKPRAALPLLCPVLVKGLQWTKGKSLTSCVGLKKKKKPCTERPAAESIHLCVLLIVPPRLQDALDRNIV